MHLYAQALDWPQCASAALTHTAHADWLSLDHRRRRGAASSPALFYPTGLTQDTFRYNPLFTIYACRLFRLFHLFFPFSFVFFIVTVALASFPRLRNRRTRPHSSLPVLQTSILPPHRSLGPDADAASEPMWRTWRSISFHFLAR